LKKSNQEASLIYDTPIRLPFELTGLKPFVFVGENETKLLICDKLQLHLVKDFSVVIKEIVKYCAQTKDTLKVHALGKWLLLNCSSFFVTNNNNSKLGMNLCVFFLHLDFLK